MTITHHNRLTVHRTIALIAAIGFVLGALAASSTQAGGTGSGPVDCCELVEEIIGDEVIGPPGAPWISPQTRAIIHAQAEAQFGELTVREAAILDFGIDEGAWPGYFQGFGIGVETIRRGVCQEP